MKNKGFLLVALLLSVFFLVGCTAQQEAPTVQQVVQDQTQPVEIPQETITETVETELLDDDDFVEIGEMI